LDRESIYVQDGPLDGLDGTIHPESSRLGFFVHQSEDGEYWYGYFDHGEKTEDGRRIFKPGKPSG
jgi:hypothetical protein